MRPGVALACQAVLSATPAASLRIGDVARRTAPPVKTMDVSILKDGIAAMLDELALLLDSWQDCGGLKSDR